MEKLKVPAFAFVFAGTMLGAAVAAKTAVDYVRVARGVFRTVRPEPRDVRWSEILSAEAASEVQSMSSGNTLLLVYNTTCSTCSRNTEKWLTFIAETRERFPTLRVIAASVEPFDVQRAYGSHIRPHAVQMAKIEDVDQLVARIGTNPVPATVLISSGRVVESHIGLVGTERRARLIQEIEATERP